MAASRRGKQRKRTAGKKNKPAPLYEVRSSGIHGRGLFATESIPADTLIGTIEGKPTTRHGAYTIWFEDESGEAEGLRITNALRFVNHARPPNAAFFDTELWSLRRIRPGDEITHDYGPGW